MLATCTSLGMMEVCASLLSKAGARLRLALQKSWTRVHNGNLCLRCIVGIQTRQALQVPPNASSNASTVRQGATAVLTACSLLDM